MIFFGDSLTDNGNLYNASFKIIPKSPPYYLGRFSNGPVWSEIVSDFYHAKYNIESTNYAVGGATAIFRRPRQGALPYYLKKEVQSYLKNTTYPQRPKTLYVFWIGANDYIDEKKQATDALVNDVVNEIIFQIRTLITNGGQQFVLIDLPDLSRAPFAKTVDQAMQERMHQLSELHHLKIQEAVLSLRNEYPNFKFSSINIYDTFNDILLNTEKYNQKYNVKITNLLDACWTGGYTLTSEETSLSLAEADKVAQLQSLGVIPCANPDAYLFWDAVHPTGVSHQVIGKMMIEELESIITVK